jgi:N-acetylated-alpha-linked acidic dipeptidase
MRTAIAVAISGAGLLWTALPEADPGIRGFFGDNLRAQRALEQRARAMPDGTRIRAYMERMAGEPHIAGSPASKAVAEYLAALLKEWGLETRIEEFEALLPWPTARTLEMTAPVRYRAKLQEQALREDPDSADKQQIPTYNAYAASGDVTAPLVYVNYGIPEDYEQLKALGIDVKGKVVIARYGRSWRGTKVKVAQENGALGCLIYSDPRDDGYFQGDIYPKGGFRPPQGVQRGSVLDMPLYPGDPLTPGWAAERGARKLARDEASTLMKIPALPISYGDAQPLLEKLAGPVAPEAWRGALPITYHVGPGPATVRLKVDFDWTVKPLYNVIATIPGSVWPDQWIIYGNHHDAWVNGAQDPASGAAALLETARVAAELMRGGWRPKRTIKFTLWDAEEFGLIGSTEWVEKHRRELAERAVAYLNSDSNGRGTIGLGGSPLLEKLIQEVLRDTRDPLSNEPLLARARPRIGSALTPGREPPKPEPDADLRLGPLGAGSDYVAFYHHTGISSVNAGFSGGGGGVYHSIYDTLAWYSRFSDVDFQYGKALAQFMTTVLLRLADAPLLGFDFASAVPAMSRAARQVRELRGGDAVKLDELLAELGRLRDAAAKWEQRVSDGSWHRLNPQALERLNAEIYRAERALAPEAGLPGRTWYKHMFAAPGIYTGYSAKTLPTVREPVEAGRVEEANSAVGPLVAAVRNLRARVERATQMLAQ